MNAMLAEWLPHILLAWSVQVVGVISPGPGVALILGVATTRGRGAALLTCVGIASGTVFLALMTIIGLAVVLSELAWAMTAVKIAGAAYLAWLGWKSVGKALHPGAMPGARGAHAAHRSMLAGLTMQVTNPKAILFWLAAIAIGGMQEAPVPAVLFFLVIAFLTSFSGHGIWALALSSRPFLAIYARARRWIEGALGVFFAFAAVKLAISRN